MKGLWTSEAKKWVFRRLDANGNLPAVSGVSLTPGETYVVLRLESFWLPTVRKGWKNFFGSVHSWVGVSGSGEMLASLTPGQLKNADVSDFPRFIPLGATLLDAVPYSGPLSMEIGLFSVKSRDLLQEFLELLDGLSKAAGQSYYSVAKPFIDPIKTGLDSFARMKDSNLEIGVYGSPDLSPGYYLAIAATSAQLGRRRLALNEDGDLTSGSTVLTQYPYLILKLEAVQTRDLGLIPDVNSAWEDVRQTLRLASVSVDAVRGVYDLFRRVVVMSNDLVPRHKDQVVREGAEKVNEAFGKTVIPATAAQLGLGRGVARQLDLGRVLVTEGGQAPRRRQLAALSRIKLT